MPLGLPQVSLRDAERWLHQPPPARRRWLEARLTEAGVPLDRFLAAAAP